MPDPPAFRHVAILGVGLIGGSFGMALRARGMAREVVGIGRNADRLRMAVDLGAVDSWTLNIEEGVHKADLLYIATPVRSVIPLLIEAVPFLDGNCVVTDAGSTKGEICRAAKELLDDSATFVGGHPMAGSEEAGVAAARVDLFEGSTYVLTPDAETGLDVVRRLTATAEGIGARVLLMDPDEHDKCVAVVSHLPHVMAAALILLAEEAAERNPMLFELVAGSFRDMTRVAASPPVLWRDICLTNASAVGESAEALSFALCRAVQYMRSGDSEGLERWFHEAKIARDDLYGSAQPEDPGPGSNSSVPRC